MRIKLASVFLLVCLALTGCAKSSSPGKSNVMLTVAAGVKLDPVFREIGALFTKAHPRVTFNFEFGIASDIVAAIKQGNAADLFASISSMEGDELVSANKMNPYKVFCTNPLLLIMSKTNPAGIATLEDLRTKPVKLVVAAETSVTGIFTRMALSHLDTVLGSGYSAAVRAKDVSVVEGGVAVVEKVLGGQADAGFAFLSDTIGAEVNTIALPAAAETVSECPIGILKASTNPSAARQFVDFLLTAPAQALLKQAGFGPAPATSP